MKELIINYPIISSLITFQLLGFIYTIHGLYRRREENKKDDWVSLTWLSFLFGWFVLLMRLSEFIFPERKK